MRKLVSVAIASLLLSCPGFSQQIPKDVVLPVETRYLNSPSASQYPNSNSIFLSDDVRFTVSPDGTTQ